LLQPATMDDMSDTPNPLVRVRKAAAKVKRAEASKAKAQAELVTAIRAAEAASIRPGAIIEASGLPRWSFYRLKGGQ
jgi:hypothetical protein